MGFPARSRTVAFAPVVRKASALRSDRFAAPFGRPRLPPPLQLIASYEKHVCFSVLTRTRIECCGASRLGEAPGLGCLELDVVGDVQRLNLAEELFAFGGIGGELIETFAEGIQLEADTLAANTVGGRSCSSECLRWKRSTPRE